MLNCFTHPVVTLELQALSTLSVTETVCCDPAAAAAIAPQTATNPNKINLFIPLLPSESGELCGSSGTSVVISFPQKTKKPRQVAEASYTSLRCKVYHFFKYCQGKSCYPLKLFCSPHSPALSPKLGTYPQSPNKLLRPLQKFHLSFP